MEERSEPARVEVELTSDAAASRRRWGGRHRRDDTGAEARSAPTEGSMVEGTGAVPDVPDVTDGEAVIRTESHVTPEAGASRRAVVVGLGAGVAGLTLGWLLGGSSGSSEQAATATPATSVPTDDETSSEASDDALTPIDTVRPTTTTRRTTTTTTLPPPETVEVVLSPKLAGADFRIVGIRQGTTTAEIDVASGSMSSRQWGVRSIEPYGTVIGDDWVYATSATLGRGQLFTGDGDVATPDLGEPWSLLWIEGTDRFWRGTQEQFSGRYASFEQVGLDGEPTGPVIDARGTWPFGVDPAGGVLTVDQGNSYSLREEGVAYIGRGELLAISAEHAVLRSCDEQLDCGLDLVDRASGEQERLPVDPEQVPGNPFGFGPFANEIAPDGGAAGLLVPTDRGIRIAVLDLVTGDIRELAGNVGGPGGVTWSPDGRFGVFLQGSTPMLFDRDSGEVEPVGDDLGPWTSVDVRPPRA